MVKSRPQILVSERFSISDNREQLNALGLSAFAHLLIDPLNTN